MNRGVSSRAEVMSSAGNKNDYPWVRITDYEPMQGWTDAAKSAERARQCCSHLEAGEILSFEGIPYNFPEDDRKFLLQQRQSDARIHKNISYRPAQDILRGNVSDRPEDAERLHKIMRHFSGEITRLLTRVLAPYASHWTLDYASFRPEEEKGRKLSLHKRNDLLHVDAFPTRPTRGARILRCFTNINPTQPRIWLTTDRFSTLAESFAKDAGLEEIAQGGDSGSFLNSLKRAIGLKAVNRSAYDRFMLRFHDYLKENSGFQENSKKIQLFIPPMTTWMCFTDSVPHAVLSGQYALEQTFIVPLRALVHPEKSPIRVLEKIAGRPLAREMIAQAA
jgi:3-deoxy-D-manno-oct-2-ulosonic acid (Kdo) hydroxylase